MCVIDRVERMPVKVKQAVMRSKQMWAIAELFRFGAILMIPESKYCDRTAGVR